MNTLYLNVITLAISVTFSTGSMAHDRSTHDFEAGMETIATDYAVAKARCAPLSVNAKDICLAEAKGTAKVARANLTTRFKYIRENRYASRVAQAEANYAVARGRCDENAGNARDVCINNAASAQAATKADAEAQFRRVDAALPPLGDPMWRTARRATISSETSRNASAGKTKTRLVVAQANCDRLAGGARNVCL